MQLDMYTKCIVFYGVILLSCGILEKGAACPPNLFGKDCMSQCHCKGGVSCDSNTGICPMGCQNGWNGPTCQRENVAYERPTRQNVGQHDSSLAVDGDMVTCSSTRKGVSGWWAVTLRQPISVHSVVITSNAKVDIKGWNIYVGTEDNMLSMILCTTARASGHSATLPCDRPVYGDHVLVVNKAGQIELCDFKIYKCSPSWYGHDCSSMCNCANVTEACDSLTGACASGCSSGWIGDDCHTACRGSYGMDCIYPCGHCADDTPCDHVTGACSQGCQHGWSGIFCNEQCPEEKFGQDCALTCGYCYGVGSCDVMTGNCVHGCEPGYMGNKCLDMCPEGRYGENCEERCGQCAGNATCDVRIGVCHTGCDKGWQGAFCTQRCSKGFYGDGCLMTCDNCHGDVCDSTSGVCLQGCKAGFKGKTCDQSCPGYYYGVNCSKQCGHCKSGQGRICDAISGACIYGCLPGYNGTRCIEVCPEGFYGKGCEKCGVCAPGTSCDPFTGRCPEGCAEGFSGELCTESEPFSDDVGPFLQIFLGVTLAIVGSILFLVTLCLVLIWRREQLPKMEKRKVRLVPDKENESEVEDDDDNYGDETAEDETRFDTHNLNGCVVKEDTEVMEIV